MIRLLLLSLCLIGVLPLAAFAQSIERTPEEILETLPTATREDARILWNRLRCVVCSGQSVAQSQAPLARDIRLRVVQELEAGKAPGTIEAEIAQRYGDAVLLSPPTHGSGQMLWLAPLIFLAIGMMIIWRMRRVK